MYLRNEPSISGRVSTQIFNSTSLLLYISPTFSAEDHDSLFLIYSASFQLRWSTIASYRMKSRRCGTMTIPTYTCNINGTYLHRATCRLRSIRCYWNCRCNRIDIVEEKNRKPKDNSTSSMNIQRKDENDSRCYFYREILRAYERARSKNNFGTNPRNRS